MSDSQNPPASGATVVATEAGAPPPVPASPSAAIQTDDLVGKTLAERYLILKRLGEGGMGTVYLAEHTTIKKRLAVKVLAAEYAHKQDLVDRFLQEARAASMIAQENVVEITDFGSTPDGSVFFVMEFLKGEDLSDTVKREGALPWGRVKPIMLQICRALSAAHERGIIHRDMKPENCYRIKRGKSEDFIKVLDFGIAKVTSDDGEEKGLTRTGMIFGTPEYMSPEQAKGERPDHRVDVYATGVILYELLTGQVPFTADTFMGILTKHMFEAPPAPSSVNPNADIPPEVEAIILKALQKDKEYRFQSMDEMAEAIEAVGTGTGSVNVVSENIARPSAGKTEFTGGGTYPPLGAGHTGEIPLEVGTSSRKGMVIGGVVVVALAIGGALAFGMGGDDPPSQDTQPTDAPAVAPEPEPEPEPAPEPALAPVQKVIAPDVKKVTFKIKTPGVDAYILDASDFGSYGMTNSDKGVEFEKSKEKLKLILRAEGYEDLTVEIKPNRNKEYTYKLKKKKRTAHRPKKRGNKPSSAGKTVPVPTLPKADPKPTAKPPKPKKPPKRKPATVNSPDLKDPFAKG